MACFTRYMAFKRFCFVIGTKQNAVFGNTLHVRFSSKHLLRRRAAVTEKKDDSVTVEIEKDAVSENNSSVLLDIHTHNTGKLPLHLKPSIEDIEGNGKRLHKVVTSLGTRKRREKKGKILLEGKRLIEVAIECGCIPETVFYNKDSAISCLDRCDSSCNIDLMKVASKALRMLSGNLDPPNVVAVCKKPTLECLSSEHVLPVTILCSNVRDPENMGSIINIAAAAGCKMVLLTKGCVDPWDRKVLKAGDAAHFFVPIKSNIEWFDIYNHIPKTASVYIADSSTDISIDKSQIYNAVNYQANHINGHFANDDGNVDQMDFRPENSPLVEPSNEFNIEELQLMEIDDQGFPCKLYSSISFPKKDIVIYVGGETEGVDPRAKELVRDNKGTSLKIPLENEMDSLNVCSALSIIVFEVKRQLEMKSKDIAKN